MEDLSEPIKTFHPNKPSTSSDVEPTTALAIRALIITVIGSAIAFFVIRPSIGIDDANITFKYARNIAAGFGYVYNVGSEHVEGSTSLLWTLITAIGFGLDRSPEQILAGLCFGIAAMTVYLTFRLYNLAVKVVGLDVHAYGQATIGALYLSLPMFFSWSVWSLMDTGIWVLFVTLFFLGTLYAVAKCLQLTETDKSLERCYVLSAFALPAVRPEGVAVAIGVHCMLFFLAMRSDKQIKRVVVTGFALSLLCFVSISAFRIAYFGYIFPNTFYAKVSMSIFSQTLEGAKYLIRFMLYPSIGIISAFFTLSLVFVLSRRAYPPNLAYFWLTPFILAGGFFFLYVALGGDHFYGFRQFQVLLPIMIAFGSVTVACLRGSQVAVTTLSMLAISIFIFSSVLPGIADFLFEPKISEEYRLAEEGRAIGQTLNLLPNTPSVGVTAAGGIAITYKGFLYDLLGLNWVEMAHAARSFAPGIKNHAAFSKEVFLKHLPDVLLPIRGKCEKRPAGYFAFQNVVLRGLFDDEDFKSKYDFVCFRDVTFFVRRDVLKDFGELRRPSL